LPAFKLLVTTRGNTTKRSGYGSSHNRRETEIRCKGVQLGSISSDKKRSPNPGDSEEDFLKSDGSAFVMVKHDVVSAILPSSRMSSIY
jgi:hypothetical protein